MGVYYNIKFNMRDHWFQAEPDFLGGRSVRRRRVRGGDLNAREIYALGGSGVRGRSRRSVRGVRGGRSRGRRGVRGGDFPRKLW